MLQPNLKNLGLISLFVAGTAGSALAGGTYTGLSSSESPYLRPAQPSGSTFSILTTGDSVNVQPDGVTPYRMAGTPDGLGAFDNGDGTFTVVMNHEFSSGLGIVREHGFKGSFISKWIIDRKSLEVLHGEDLIHHAYQWDLAQSKWVALASAFSRFCSADLAEISAFFNKKSGLGYDGHIFLTGEENGSSGRLFAHLMNGESYEIPAAGKFSWENAVANPSTGAKTVVLGTDDSGGGQLYVYVGEKTDSTHPVIAAGLTNGTLYGIKVNGYPEEIEATGIPSGTTFTAHGFGDVTSWSGPDLQNASDLNDVTGWQRPEDAHWDPEHPNDLYFVTTASFGGNSRLWRLRFNDPADPTAGGTVDMLLDGSEAPEMMDNITVANGKVLIEEDPGSAAYLAKIWSYDIGSGRLTLVAEHDADRFQPGAPNYITSNEEASGIISLKGILGASWFLATDQVHASAGDPELVEGGQLFVLHIGGGK